MGRVKRLLLVLVMSLIANLMNILRAESDVNSVIPADDENFNPMDYFGGNELLAEGHVVEVGADWAIVKIDKMISKKFPIKIGTTVRM